VVNEVLRQGADLPDAVIIVNPEDNDITVNALQRAAGAVIQKSLREGFGLVVTEAMWKARPVIGGDTGGIAYQIIDGVNGFLVQTVEGAATRLRQVLSNPHLARSIGAEAHARVQSRFLPPHYLRNWLCLLMSLEQPADGVTILDA
jgi:trehalose synthase